MAKLTESVMIRVTPEEKKLYKSLSEKMNVSELFRDVLRSMGKTFPLECGRVEDPLDKYAREEIGRCAKDINYFAERYYHIVNTNMTGGDQLLQPYSKQVEVLKSMQKHRLVIVRASRQTGKDLCAEVYTLWKALFHPGSSIFVVTGCVTDSCNRFMNKIKYALERLPHWMKPDLAKTVKNELILANHSKIHASSYASALSASRGMSINDLVMLEPTFYNDTSDLWVSTFPVVCSQGGRCFMLSTPFSRTSGSPQVNIFEDIWKQATQEQNQSGWIPITMGWWSVPGRDQLWKNKMIETIGEEQFEKEYGMGIKDMSLQDTPIPLETYAVQPTFNKDWGNFFRKTFSCGWNDEEPDLKELVELAEDGTSLDD